MRKVVETRDPKTRMHSEEIEYYSNYHPIDGIQTPFQITRERNGIKIYQVFFDKCDYNTGLSPMRSSPRNLSNSAGRKSARKKRNERKDSDKDNDKN